ncbi:MAG: hypothetical protein WC869_05185 [Phycisphaerae bacterium]|jgi:hypothetical protein
MNELQMADCRQSLQPHDHEVRETDGPTLRTSHVALRTASSVLLCVLCVAVLFAGGCGNVYLKGEALTAAETSTMDAYQAVQRLGGTGVPPVSESTAETAVVPSTAATATPAPTWMKAYLEENFKQWRFFVRSARKDLTWGPKLADE